MGFKRLVINNKAVSSIIGVILLIAITVIPAVAIEPFVFGQGTAQSVPMANLDTQAAVIANVAAYDYPTYYPRYTGYEKYEHPFGRFFESIDPLVFGYGTAQGVPQANINIVAINKSAIKLEHFGGDTIFIHPSSTKVTFATDDASYDIDVFNQTSDIFFNVGDTQLVLLTEDANAATPATIIMTSGEFATVKIVDVKTSQLITDRDLRF